MMIIAFDPGLVTGVCKFCIDPFEGVTQVDSHELDFLGVGQYIKLAIGHRFQSEIQIVCEKFTITNQTAKNSAAPWSLEVTGLVRWYTERYGYDLYQPMPSQTKSLITNDVLKRAELFVKGEHARDAARAGLYYAITKQGLGKHWLLGMDGD